MVDLPIWSLVLPKPSLINANINIAIDAMCKIVQPDDINPDNIDHLDDALPSNTGNSFRPVIPVSRESNKPIVGTDNDILLRGAFPDKFLFWQGIPKGLPTHRNWKHFALYYDGQFDNPLFIARGFNQLQHASCIQNWARIIRNYPPQHRQMKWLVGVQTASCGCDCPNAYLFIGLDCGQYFVHRLGVKWYLLFLAMFLIILSLYVCT